jgi:hypothetical protein
MTTKKNSGYGARSVIRAIAVVCALALAALSMAGCPTEDDPPPPDTHVHDWEWTETTPATCIATGVESGVCKLNAAHTTTRTIPIDPDAHDFSNMTTIQPTCEVDGSASGTCPRCNKNGTFTLKKLGHDYQWTETRVPLLSTLPYQAAEYGVNAGEPGPGIETEICSHDASHKGGTRLIYSIGGILSSYTGGSVTVSTSRKANATSAFAGEIVTITLTPDEGYEVDRYYVQTWDATNSTFAGTATEVPGTGNIRTYTMPANAISFWFIFIEKPVRISGTVSVTVDGVVPYEVQILLKTDGSYVTLGFSRLYNGETAWSIDVGDIAAGTELYFEISALDNTGALIGFKQEVKRVTFNGADMSNIDIGDVALPKIGGGWF